VKPPVFNHKQYTDLEADYMILKAENEKLKAQLSTTNKRLEAAVEEVCRRCPDGDVIDGLKHYPCDRCKWRGPQAEKGRNNA
jgi:hypothetical protein